MKLSVRAVFGLGIVACLVAGVLGEAWSLLAAQAFESPWRVQGFEVFCSQFATRSWWTAVLTLVQLEPAAKGGLFSNTRRSWAVAVLWSVGAVLSLGAFAYAAATGIRGVQLRDSGQLGFGVLSARVFGDTMLLSAWAIALPSVYRGLRDHGLTSRT